MSHHWDRIKEAAAESSWVHSGHTIEDWVADVCDFLRHGPASQDGEECHEGNHGRCWYCELGRACPSKTVIKDFGEDVTTEKMLSRQNSFTMYPAR